MVREVLPAQPGRRVLEGMCDQIKSFPSQSSLPCVDTKSAERGLCRFSTSPVLNDVI